MVCVPHRGASSDPVIPTYTPTLVSFGFALLISIHNRNRTTP